MFKKGQINSNACAFCAVAVSVTKSSVNILKILIAHAMCTVQNACIKI